MRRHNASRQSIQCEAIARHDSARNGADRFNVKHLCAMTAREMLRDRRNAGSSNPARTLRPAASSRRGGCAPVRATSLHLSWVLLRTRKKAASNFRAGRQCNSRPRGSSMSRLSQLLVRFQKDQSGATAIEYGLIAAGIAVAIIAVVQGLGTNLNTTFSSVSGALK
jgi:pilus assembly protein Flp/PilA